VDAVIRLALLAAAWLALIAAADAEPAARAILVAAVAMAGCVGAMVGVVKPRTTEEKLADLELRVVMACGAAGAAVVEAERSKS